MLAADATATAICLIIIKSSGLHSPPHSSSSRRSISGSYSSSSSDHRDTLASGDHRMFVFVAAIPGISRQNVKLYLPHRLTQVPQHRTLPRRVINRPTTLQRLLKITRLLRENTDTSAHAAGPAWTARTFRLILELLDRPGCDYPVLPPRRVCVFKWNCV